MLGPKAFEQHLYVPCQVHLAIMEPFNSKLGHALRFG